MASNKKESSGNNANANASDLKKGLQEDKSASGSKEQVNAAQKKKQNDKTRRTLTIYESSLVKAGEEWAKELKWEIFVNTLDESNKILITYDPNVQNDRKAGKSSKALKLTMKGEDMQSLRKVEKDSYEKLSEAIKDLDIDVYCFKVEYDWKLALNCVKDESKPQEAGGTSPAASNIDNYAPVSPNDKQEELQTSFRAIKMMEKITAYIKEKNPDNNTKHEPIWVSVEFTMSDDNNLASELEKIRVSKTKNDHLSLHDGKPLGPAHPVK